MKTIWFNGFRRIAGNFGFWKCGGLPTAATFALLIFVPHLLAAEAASDFTAANEFYAKGKFTEAAAIYEKMLRTSGQSPALLFNDANAEFKAGHLGRAITAYRRAAQLAPRDSEIRANLDFVRNQVQGATVREGRWQYWLGTLSLNEWTLLAAGAFWLTFLLLSLRQIRPALSPRLRSLTRLAAGLTVLSSLGLALQAANHFNSSIVVVTDPEVTVRSGPFDEAQNAFTARDGAEFRVLDRHEDWVQVADRSGKIGWLSRKQVEVLPGA